MRPSALRLIPIAFGILMLATPVGAEDKPATKPNRAGASEIWGTDLDAALKSAQAHKRHVLVYAYDTY